MIFYISIKWKKGKSTQLRLDCWWKRFRIFKSTQKNWCKLCRKRIGSSRVRLVKHFSDKQTMTKGFWESFEGVGLSEKAEVWWRFKAMRQEAQKGLMRFRSLERFWLSKDLCAKDFWYFYLKIDVWNGESLLKKNNQRSIKIYETFLIKLKVHG